MEKTAEQETAKTFQRTRMVVMAAAFAALACVAPLVIRVPSPDSSAPAGNTARDIVTSTARHTAVSRRSNFMVTASSEKLVGFV